MSNFTLGNLNLKPVPGNEKGRPCKKPALDALIASGGLGLQVIGKDKGCGTATLP